MYYDFELEQIVKEVSKEWKVTPSEKEVYLLINLYRGAEKEAERIKLQLEEELSEMGKDVDGDSLVDIKPFDEVVYDFYRERYFNSKYKGLSISQYFNSPN